MSAGALGDAKLAESVKEVSPLWFTSTALFRSPVNLAERVPKWRAEPSLLHLAAQADLTCLLRQGKSTGLPNGLLLAGEMIHEKVTGAEMRC